MFRGGGYAHRGTGITSGLATPKRGYVDRPGSYQGIGESSLPSGVEDKWQAYYDMLKGVQGERAPFDRFDANVEPLMTMFGKWMSGKSYQPGLGGALEIAGEGLTEAAPGFGKAIREKRAYEAATGTEDASLRMKALDLALKETPKKELQGEPNTVYGKFPGIDDPTYAQEFVYKDGATEYRIGNNTYTAFEPMEKPKDAPTPIIQHKSLPNNMIQDMLSTDGGDNYEPFGEPYPRFKPDKEDKEPQWQYKSTIDKTIERDGNKFKQTYALYAKEGEVEPKKVMIFEEAVTGDPQVRKSGNIVITDGDNKGLRRAAIEFKDGIVRYYEPSSPDAATKGPYDGFVDVKDKYEWYNQEVAGGPETIFGTVNAEKIAVTAANTSNTLASGAALINDALTIGGNLDTLNRAILDKGGKFLSQIPILGEDMKAGLYSAFDEDPDAIQKFITNSRIFVAQNIATITGEGSARVSEPERFLANQALATLDTMTDAESSIAAIQASLAATYVQQHRQLTVAGAKVLPVSGDGKNGFDEAGAVYHANILATKFGFSKKDIARTLRAMRDMENLGLQQLTTITNAQNDYFKNNKQDIQSQYAALLPDVTGGVLE